VSERAKIVRALDRAATVIGVLVSEGILSSALSIKNFNKFVISFMPTLSTSQPILQRNNAEL
jgi:hypothetical protein